MKRRSKAASKKRGVDCEGAQNHFIQPTNDLGHLEQVLTQDSQSLNLRVSIRRGKRCCDLGYFWGYASLDIIKTALGRAVTGR